MDQMPKEISQAINLVMQTVTKLVKDGQNNHGDYRYASTDAFFRALNPALAEAGLIVKPRAVSCQIETMDVTDRAGKTTPRRMIIGFYTFALIHAETGVTWCDEGDRRMIALDFTGPQSFGAIESYATKTFLRTLFLMATGDKDADSAEQFEAEVTKSRVRAAKTKNETGVSHISLDFGNGFEELPAADVPARVMEYLIEIGPEEGATWWDDQKVGRKAFSDQFPTLAFDLKKKVEKFFLSKEQAA